MDMPIQILGKQFRVYKMRNHKVFITAFIEACWIDIKVNPLMVLMRFLRLKSWERV